ncbi:MAG: thioesterase family protein [Pseudomonadota bacterium]
MDGSFFTTEDDHWFVPTAHSRGPWHVDHCHAGPPTALAVRALERAIPEQRLTRITVDLLRPIPHAGFFVEASVTKAGRGVSRASARLLDADGRESAVVAGLYMVETEPQNLPSHAESIGPPEAAELGGFPIAVPLHDQPTFVGGVEVKYPPGEGPEPGPTTVWMRTVPVLPDETPSPFQRICPLGDCGNAFGRNANATRISFVNPDLTIVLHRDPEGEWLGMRAVGYWEANGIGTSDAALYDQHGCVGRAMQTLFIRPSPVT